MFFLSEEVKEKSRNYTIIVLMVLSCFNFIDSFSIPKLFLRLFTLLISYVSMFFTTKYTEKILQGGASKKGGDKIAYYLFLGLLLLILPIIAYTIIVFLLITAIAIIGEILGMCASIGPAVILITIFSIIAISLMIALNICLMIPYLRALTVLYIENRQNRCPFPMD